MPQLSLIIPVYNEEVLIDQLYKRTTTALEALQREYEVICVDDGSYDQSLMKLIGYHSRDKRFKVLSLSRNFGQQPAILAGMAQSTGDYVAVMDADLQDPPELLEKFFAKLDEGYDLVYAVRKKRKENFLKRFIYWAYYRILQKISNLHIPLDSGDFSLMRRTVVNQILLMQEQSLYIRGLRSWVGFKQVGLEYD